MRKQRTCGRIFGHIGVVLLMSVLWLTTAVLAASPQLHALLHHEAQAVSHECVVTLLTKNQLWVDCLAGFAAIVVFLVLGLAPLPVVRSAGRLDVRLHPSRAPPELVLLQF